MYVPEYVGDRDPAPHEPVFEHVVPTPVTVQVSVRLPPYITKVVLPVKLTDKYGESEGEEVKTRSTFFIFDWHVGTSVDPFEQIHELDAKSYTVFVTYNELAELLQMVVQSPLE